MTIRQLLYLKTIAEKKSYTMASQALFVTQPTLSTAIQQLERELDVPLLVRESGKEVHLSEYGSALLPYIDKVLNALREGEETVRSMKTSASGVVKVMLSYASSFSTVLNMLKTFGEDPANSRISVQTIVRSSRADAIRALNDGSIDLAFFGSQDNEDANAAPVTGDTVIALVNKTHPLASRPVLVMEDLRAEPIISYSQGSRFYRWLSGVFERNDFSPAMIRNVSVWSELVSEIILYNGIAITPQVLVDEDVLVPIPFAHRENPWRTHILWARDRKLSYAAAKVRDYCIDNASLNEA